MAETTSEIAKIDETEVPIVMFADDAIELGTEEKTVQQLFPLTDKAARRHRTDISVLKSELLEFQVNNRTLEKKDNH